MGLTSLLIALLVIGLVLYIVNLLPIDARIKQIAFAIVAVVVVIWLIKNLLPLAGLG